MIIHVTKMKGEKLGSGGIRTHASEETGALNQRLRPLGHATCVVWECKFFGSGILSSYTLNWAVKSDCPERTQDFPQEAPIDRLVSFRRYIGLLSATQMSCSLRGSTSITNRVHWVQG